MKYFVYDKSGLYDILAAYDFDNDEQRLQVMVTNYRLRGFRIEVQPADEFPSVIC